MQDFQYIQQAKKLNRLKEILRQEGRTNKWLAGKLEKNEVTVSRWCRNVQQPDLETLYAIARFLGVRVCALLVEEEDVNEI